MTGRGQNISHQKPVAALTHSSATELGVFIWLKYRLCSIGRHKRQAPQWLCPCHTRELRWGRLHLPGRVNFIQISRHQLPTILLQQIKKSHQLKVEWDGESFKEGECN